MDKQRAAQLDRMLMEWAQAEKEGVFESLGWHGGMDAEPAAKSVGSSPSNRAQVAALTTLRRNGHADAVLIHGAIALAMSENRRAIMAVKYRYLAKGTWQQQADALSLCCGGMSKDAFRQYVKAGIYAIEAELQTIGRSTGA
ncbi:MAG: hypothetical protein V7677_10315 [Motiliproteus sp.]